MMLEQPKSQALSHRYNYTIITQSNGPVDPIVSQVTEVLGLPVEIGIKITTKINPHIIHSLRTHLIYDHRFQFLQFKLPIAVSLARLGHIQQNNSQVSNCEYISSFGAFVVCKELLVISYANCRRTAIGSNLVNENSLACANYKEKETTVW